MKNKRHIIISALIIISLSVFLLWPNINSGIAYIKGERFEYKLFLYDENQINKVLNLSSMEEYKVTYIDKSSGKISFLTNDSYMDVVHKLSKYGRVDKVNNKKMIDM